MIDIAIYGEIKNILLQARSEIVRRVNTTMVSTYFQIGKIIVEHELGGNIRAGYGEETLKKLSQELIKEFGKGFSLTNLKQMKQFFLCYGKSQTLSDQSEGDTQQQSPDNLLLIQQTLPVVMKFKLSWSHYLILMRLNEQERNFYEYEAISNNRSLRELQRQYDSALFERIVLSRDKKLVLQDNIEKYHHPESPKDILKDPYILEFLGFEASNKYSESEIEQALIEKIEHFLLELGKGFTFVGRQQRLSFDEEHFFVDLVFYNRLLKCFVLIDLKLGKLKHQDLGQMQMYVNYYDRFVKSDDENKTIGIILCKDKKDTLVEITLPEDSNIFASKYALYLPSKDELKKEIDTIGNSCL